MCWTSSRLTVRIKKLPFSYPCGMLNADVHANYTNHQMQTKNT